MATREVVTNVCDECGAEGEGVETHTLRLDRRRPREVELCGECVTPVRELVAAGRPA